MALYAAWNLSPEVTVTAVGPGAGLVSDLPLFTCKLTLGSETEYVQEKERGGKKEKKSRDPGDIFSVYPKCFLQKYIY